MGIFLWIILGLAAGWIASMIAGTNHQQGMLADIVVGILGAITGGFLANLLGTAGVTGFNFYSLLIATLGATLLLFVKKSMFRTV